MEHPDSTLPAPSSGASDATTSTRSPLARPTPRTVVQVAPPDVHGVRTVEVGTIGWGVALVALLPFYPTLQEHGRDWWVWVCSAGLGIGLLGVDHARRRRDVAAGESRVVSRGAGGVKETVSPPAPGRRRSR